MEKPVADNDVAVATKAVEQALEQVRTAVAAAGGGITLSSIHGAGRVLVDFGLHTSAQHRQAADAPTTVFISTSGYSRSPMSPSTFTGGGTPSVAAAQAIEQLRSAVREHEDVAAAAVAAAGVPERALGALRSWIDVQLDARTSLLQADLSQQLHAYMQEVNAAMQATLAATTAVSVTAKPLELLSASELGQALGGLGDQAVRLRENNREVFSVLKAGRKRGREYPAFQAWEGIVGDPLKEVLGALKELDGAAAYGFFSVRSHELADLTPVEVLHGALTRARVLAPESVALLNEPHALRLEAVLAAAKAYYADATA
jgi:hypothetical protein